MPLAPNGFGKGHEKALEKAMKRVGKMQKALEKAPMSCRQALEKALQNSLVSPCTAKVFGKGLANKPLYRAGLPKMGRLQFTDGHPRRIWMKIFKYINQMIK